jgi:1-acyl-sn-glycerol-3-phosphate acyltransferase
MIAEAKTWLERARRLVPKRDRDLFLSPVRLVARFVRFVLAHHAGLDSRDPVGDVRARDPALVSLVLDFFRAVGRHYFRLRIQGVEHVPSSGPVLLVANHNGGLLPTDSFFTALAVHDHYGPHRVPYVLTHDFAFSDPVLRSYALRLGLLRAGHHSAQQVFEHGGCLLVYPGSDLDTFRPFAERSRVVLGGRTGFLKLALRARVPIVPVVSTGTHEQLVVLARGDRLARSAGLHAWSRSSVFPLVLALPWGLMLGFVPYLPLPAQTTVAFGAPIAWPELGPDDAERPEVLDRCYRHVEARMQRMLDRLSEGRRFLLGKPDQLHG